MADVSWIHLVCSRRPYLDTWLDQEGDHVSRFALDDVKSSFLDGCTFDVIEVWDEAIRLSRAIRSQRKFLIASLQVYVGWNDDELSGRNRKELRKLSMWAKELRAFIDDQLVPRVLRSARDHERKARHLRKMLKERS